MKYILLIMMVVIAILVGPHIYTNWRTDRDIGQQIKESVDEQNRVGPGGKNRRGHVEVDGSVWTFTEHKLHELLHSESSIKSLVYFWNWSGVKTATASAMGIDGQHHFANSYLVGYQPFETQHIWVPLYTLVLRKRYQYDHLQYSSLKDVWQNSKQAFFYTRGDCEDHAMILADWLISMGIDARVVLGFYKEEGHAWVVFFLNGKAYLLEATSKRKIRNMGAIPAAALMVDYHPTCQFNRDKFWVNTGSRLITRYNGAPWKLKSRFVVTDGGV